VALPWSLFEQAPPWVVTTPLISSLFWIVVIPRSSLASSPSALPLLRSRQEGTALFTLLEPLLSLRLRMSYNNNTFTWSGPSGVIGCTGQRRLAPAAGWCKSFPRSDGCHAVPLNLLNRVW
jgi:hypothetical protein